MRIFLTCDFYVNYLMESIFKTCDQNMLNTCFNLYLLITLGVFIQSMEYRIKNQLTLHMGFLKKDKLRLKWNKQKHN